MSCNNVFFSNYIHINLVYISIDWKCNNGDHFRIQNSCRMAKSLVIILGNKSKSFRTPRPGFSLFECYRQKLVYWSSSWARILNVQDKIKERPKDTSSNIPSTCIPSTTIAGADQHSFNTCLRYTSYRGCRPPPPKFRFNVGTTLQPIAGSMPANRLRHWPNTNLSPGLLGPCVEVSCSFLKLNLLIPK